MLRYSLPLALSLFMTSCVGKTKFDALAAEQASTAEQLKACQDHGADLQSQLDAANQHASELDQEKTMLLKDQSKLESSVAEMKKAIDELNKRKAEADLRIAQFKELTAKFQQLIDAGKLRVRIVDGRMVVELATDVLFDSGSASLSADGKKAIAEVATILASIPDRHFQIEGHTDNVPIATAQYPSNWDLAAGRSLTVVKAMIDGGMDPQRVSAASFGETHPVVANDTKENKALNRRIEIVVVPDLSGLPGFEELQTMQK